MQAIADARLAAKMHMLRQQDIRAVQRDEHRTDKCFEPGSLVYVSFPNLRSPLTFSKFEAKYAGPFRVIGRIRPNTYELMSIDPKAKAPIISNVARMKEYTERLDYLQIPDSFIRPQLPDPVVRRGVSRYGRTYQPVKK